MNLVRLKCCISNAGLCGEVVILCINISCVTGGPQGALGVKNHLPVQEMQEIWV